MQELRTVIKYPGAKWGLAEWIIGLMPSHKCYVEPFFGSGAVFFRKAPSRIEFINDIDGEVVNLFRCIRDRPKELERAIALTPYSRAEYETALASRAAPPPNAGGTPDVERALAFLVQHWQGHGFRTYCRSGWKNDIAGREYAYAMQYWNRLPAWIAAVVERLKQAQIECSTAVELIRRVNNPEVLIYADPPYLLSTRHGKKQYSYEMTGADHAELLEALLAHQGPVLLSGYDNPLYNGALEGWDKLRHLTVAEGGQKRVETLWCNFGVQTRLEL